MRPAAPSTGEDWKRRACGVGLQWRRDTGLRGELWRGGYKEAVNNYISR
jgi:hypothetical protein